MDDSQPGTPTPDKRLERRAAQAMVAAYVEVARSVGLAQWLQQTRERSLERRAERSQEMSEILALQHQIDAQQPQAAMLNAAADHVRSQTRNLASFARAGLTLEDFERLGVGSVMDLDELKLELERQAAAESAADGEPATEAGEPGASEAADQDDTAEPNDP